MWHDTMPCVERRCGMRHDPASAAVVVMLRGLKMYGMAQAADDLIDQGVPAIGTAVPILSQLLKAEVAESEVRSVAYQMKAARFPAHKDLASSDFDSGEQNEAMIRQLPCGDFITRQTGNASCRDKVCTYVKRSGVS